MKINMTLHKVCKFGLIIFISLMVTAELNNIRTDEVFIEIPVIRIEEISPDNNLLWVSTEGIVSKLDVQKDNRTIGKLRIISDELDTIDVGTAVTLLNEDTAYKYYMQRINSAKLQNRDINNLQVVIKRYDRRMDNIVEEIKPILLILSVMYLLNLFKMSVNHNSYKKGRKKMYNRFKHKPTYKDLN